MTLHETAPALVAAARDGDPQAWFSLVDQWLPAVLAWADRFGGPGVDPEDAAQDVFVVALSRLHTLRDHRRFPAWMVGITRRVLASHRRRAWVLRWLPGPVPDSPDGRPPDWPSLTEEARRAREALARLPLSQREVIVLCDVEERSHSEVAVLLDIPLGTVKSRLLRGRAKLRLDLGEPEAATALDLVGSGK